MTFLEQAREQALAALSAPITDQVTLAELQGMHVRNLMPRYMTWLHRRVAARPRFLHRSARYMANSLHSDPQYQASIATIEHDMERGTDLTRYLSARINVTYEQRNSGRKYTARPDLDMLLNDLGVHHLHVSLTMETVGNRAGFVRGDTHVMFVLFRPYDAYLIDIFDHRSWTLPEVGTILATEWPDQHLVPKIAGFTAQGSPPDAAAIKAARDSGLAMPVQVAQDLYMTPMVTTGGTSIDDTIASDDILNSAVRLQKAVDDPASEIAQWLAQQGIAVADLQFCITGYGRWELVDTNIGTKVLTG